MQGWLVVWRINVALAIFQPYCDLEAGDKPISEIVAARPEIEPRTSCSANQELNHYTTAAPHRCRVVNEVNIKRKNCDVKIFTLPNHKGNVISVKCKLP